MQSMSRPRWRNFRLLTFLVFVIVFCISLHRSIYKSNCLVYNSLLCYRQTHRTGTRRVGDTSADWWNFPDKLPEEDRYFRKSILYVKPHKTGSESFKETLIYISNYYNLTNQKNIERKQVDANNTYDVLIRHQHYKEGETERQIRGWDEGLISKRNISRGAERRLIRIVTIRNPIDRLFSHYFSQRRFGRFTPKRGFVKSGRLSEREEIEDFEEWLSLYPSNKQIRYLMNKPDEEGEEKENEVMLRRIEKIVHFYDYVVVAEQWKLSLCLFGYMERILPTVLKTKPRNINGPRAKRFDVKSVIVNVKLYDKILMKVKCDFLLYNRLLQKYFELIETVESREQLERYCAVVRSKNDLSRK